MSIELHCHKCGVSISIGKLCRFCELDLGLDQLVASQDGTRVSCSQCGAVSVDASHFDVLKNCKTRRNQNIVDHPPHYTSSASGIECIDVTEHLTFCIGNAIKYLWRAGLKGDALEDLRKAAWYVQREIGRLEKLADKTRG